MLGIITFDAFAKDDIGYGDASLDFAGLLKVFVKVLWEKNESIKG